MISSQEKHHDTIDHLKKKFELTSEELEILDKIKASDIHSISFTTDGGFDIESGEFYPVGRKNCYKIKIKYEEGHSTKLKFVYLMPSI